MDHKGIYMSRLHVNQLLNIAQMNKDCALQFKSFVVKIVDCLEDADGGVRDAAKATIVELFQ
jgi:CLIP-associating protein 1/2